jgi:hypothetical protein
MQRFQYRTLVTSVWVKHVEWGRKRGGDKPDRILTVIDSEAPNAIRLTDEKGDDREAFERRVHVAFLAYLNTIGDGGWQVLEFAGGRTTPDTILPFLNGSFLLMRTS